MNVKSYLDDDDCSVMERPIKSKVVEDGRRIEEYITVNRLDDGSVEHVHEVREEVIPMRVAKRVRRLMAEVPVEETIECHSLDGSVSTNVKSLDRSLLDLGRQPTTLEAVAASLRDLQQQLANSPAVVDTTPKNVAPEAVETSAPAQQRSFLNRASAKHGVSKMTGDALVADAAPVLTEAPASGEGWLTAIAWVVLAVVAGLVTWSVV